MGLARTPGPAGQWALPAGAHLLVGSLPSSDKWRGYLADAEDLPHLVEGWHVISGRLGGLTKRWRFDRMATVVNPNTGRVTSSFAAVAKHYGVALKLSPPRHGNRKGSVEKANDSAARRSAGGGPSRTTSRRPRSKPPWMRSELARATAGSASVTGQDHRRTARGRRGRVGSTLGYQERFGTTCLRRPSVRPGLTKRMTSANWPRPLPGRRPERHRARMHIEQSSFVAFRTVVSRSLRSCFL